MRTAEDIVNEYRQRKYDTFRIRAIAALRPEPMRSQILSILDAEEMADAVFDEVAVEEVVSAPVPASLDVISDVMAEESELVEEVEQPELITVAAAHEEEEFDVMAAGSSLFSSMAAAPRAKDLAMRAEQNSTIAHGVFVGGEAEAGDPPDEELVDDDFFDPEEETEIDLRDILTEASVENESEEDEIEEEESEYEDDEEESEYEDEEEESEYEDEEEESEYEEEEEDINEVSAEASDQDEIEEEDEAEESEYEDEEEESEYEEEEESEYEEESEEEPQAKDELPAAAISMEDDATHYLEDKADNKILFMFHDEGKASADDLAQAELHLVKEEKEESEWYDYGAGLIVVPKSMHDVQTAYAKALNTEDDIVEPSLDELVESFENDDALDELEEEIPASCEVWKIPSSSTASTVDNTEEDLKREIAELENSLTNIEKRLRESQVESDDRSRMVVEAEDLVALQQNQLEEVQSEIAQRDATIRELEAAIDGMHEFNSEAVIKRAQVDDIERERNILKTDVIPALEDQQLELIDMLEEETLAHTNSEKRLRGMRRRMMVGYSAAIVACLFSVSLTVLNKYSLSDMRYSSQQNIQLVENTETGLVDGQSERLAELTRENEVLQAALSQKEAEWKRTEGSLRRLISAKEEDLASRHADLRNNLNSMLAERDKNLHQYALMQTRQDSSTVEQGAKPVQQAGAVTTAVASVEPAPKTLVATYKVKPGDDLGTICKKHFGGPINWPLVNKIAKQNGLSSPNSIQPGQVLNLAMIEVE